jgi:hypothetical protein
MCNNFTCASGSLIETDEASTGKLFFSTYLIVKDEDVLPLMPMLKSLVFPIPLMYFYILCSITLPMGL